MLTHKGKIGDVEYEVNPMISYTRGKYVDWEENVRPTSGDDLTDEQIAENILWNARYNRSGKWDDLQWGFQTNGFFTNQAQIDSHPVDIDLAGNQTMIVGNLIFVDQNGDGIIDWKDQVVIVVVVVATHYIIDEDQFYNSSPVALFRSMIQFLVDLAPMGCNLVSRWRTTICCQSYLVVLRETLASE